MGIGEDENANSTAKGGAASENPAATDVPFGLATEESSADPPTSETPQCAESSATDCGPKDARSYSRRASGDSRSDAAGL